MNKTLSVTLALICTSLTVIGCETTNRDYRGTGRVVDVTYQPQRTSPDVTCIQHAVRRLLITRNAKSILLLRSPMNRR